MGQDSLLGQIPCISYRRDPRASPADYILMTPEFTFLSLFKNILMLLCIFLAISNEGWVHCFSPKPVSTSLLSIYRLAIYSGTQARHSPVLPNPLLFSPTSIFLQITDISFRNMTVITSAVSFHSYWQSVRALSSFWMHLLQAKANFQRQMVYSNMLL